MKRQPLFGGARRKGIGAIGCLCAALLLVASLPVLATAPATCVLSGTVLNGSGVPLNNAKVTVRVIQPVLVSGAGIAAQDISTRTAADGTWSLTLVQGLNAQIDIPAISIAKDFVVPEAVTANYSGLTLYQRGTLTPATILSNTGPSMGGDLTGSSPNPSVVGLRGQPLASGNCANGQARVYDSGTSSYTCQTVKTGTGVTSVTAGTGISVTGTATDPVVNVSGIPEAQVTNLTTDLNAKVAKAGDTMTGPLVLSGAPTIDLHAATKKYVDDGLATKLATGGSITQAQVTGLAAALAAKEDTANKGQLNGYAALNGSGIVPSTQLPATMTPSLHASTHASGGSDPVTPLAIGAANSVHTHAESSVTGLVADLAAKGGLATPNTWAALQTFNGGFVVTGPQTFAGDIAATSGNAIGVLMADPTTLAGSAVPGGALAPATYYYVVTALDGAGGETLASNEISVGVGGLNGSVSMTWDAVPGAASYRIWRGTAAGMEDHYQTAAGASFTDAGAAGSAGTLPVTETAYGVRWNGDADSWVVGGNVGIGKSVPTTALDVTGTVTATAFAGNLTGNVTGTASGNALATRNINTTAPLAGGGDLSADRTLSIAITPANDGGAVALQGATPGTQQTGHLNVSGTAKAGTFLGNLTGNVTGNLTGNVTGNATTASDGLTSATGTAPLTLNLAAKALTGSIAITPADNGGAVALQGATPGSAQTGHVNVTGTVKAATFSGNLTGDVTGNVTGNVSGTSANVTGVVATANGGFGANESAATGFPKFTAGVVAVGPLVSGDIPNNGANTTGTASNVTGTVAIANGGTGATTQTVAFNNLSPLTSKGDLIVHNGANNVRLGVGADGTVLTADAASGSGVKWAAVTAGTVTSVATGAGLSGGPITATGTIDLRLNGAGGLSKTLGGGSNELGIAAGGVSDAMLANAKVNQTTTLTGTAPIRIDGGASADLSANRTISVNDATGIAKGVVQLTGDLGGTAASPSVATVAGSTAANVHAAELLANASTDANTFGAIVRRDGATGGFSAGVIVGTLLGNVTGNVTGNASGTAANVTGTVAVANGGTGAVNAAGARANLSAAASGANSDITSLSALATPLSVPQGGTGAATLTGVVHGNGAAAMTASNVVLTSEVTGVLPVANGGSGTSTAFTTGSIPFAGALGVYTQDNANLFYDDTNNRLGLGTATPERTLDVNGVIEGRGIAAPLASSAGNGTLYFDTATNHWMISENTGAAVPILSASGVTGTGANKQLTYWTGATTLGGGAGLQYDAATGRLSVGAGAAPAYAVDVLGDVNVGGVGNTFRIQGAGFASFGGTLAKHCLFVGDTGGNCPGATNTYNVAVGYQALDSAGGGASSLENVAVGANALAANTNAAGSSAVGNKALMLATGGFNTALGYYALASVTTGVENTAVGDSAGATAATGDYNTFVGAAADSTSAAGANRTAIGANASVGVDYGVALGDPTNALVGIRTDSPAQALDVNGAVATRAGSVALVNGLNSNIATPANSYVRITGPAAVFSVGGFTNGTDGRILRLYNTVAFAMTIVNEDAASAAANRIKTLTGANVTLRAGTSFATFIYDATDSRWILASTN